MNGLGVAQRLKASDFRKLRNTRKISNLDGDVA